MGTSNVIRAPSWLEVRARKLKEESETTVIPRNVAILETLTLPFDKMGEAIRSTNKSLIRNILALIAKSFCGK